MGAKLALLVKPRRDTDLTHRSMGLTGLSLVPSKRVKRRAPLPGQLGWSDQAEAK